MYNFDYVVAVANQYDETTVNKTISPSETMNNQWYFGVGKSAIENIIIALMASRLQSVDKVLDIPCGHGRVLRHLVKLFPEAEFHACDLDKNGVDFCASTFDAKPIYSQEELTKVDFGSKYDIIWVGSLFTHTSRDVTKRWTAHLAKFLNPQGIVIATVHGRWCQYVHNVAPYIEETSWRELIEDYTTNSHGYRDYLKEESHSYISGSYGISLTKPHITIKDLEDIPGIRIYLYLERGWSDHQDVVVFGKPSHNDPWPVMIKKA